MPQKITTSSDYKKLLSEIWRKDYSKAFINKKRRRKKFLYNWGNRKFMVCNIIVKKYSLNLKKNIISLLYGKFFL